MVQTGAGDTTDRSTTRHAHAARSNLSHVVSPAPSLAGLLPEAPQRHTHRLNLYGTSALIQAGQRRHVERTNAWHNAFNRFQRCYERREKVIDAFFDLAAAIITVRSLIRRAWITHRWDTRPARRR